MDIRIDTGKRQFDVPTFFGRDLNLCKTFAEGWYGADLGTPAKQVC